MAFHIETGESTPYNVYEEVGMVLLSHTDDYRDEDNILDSECIEIIEAEERSESEEEDGENENDTIYVQSQLHKDRRLPKRGLSHLSTTLSSTA